MKHTPPRSFSDSSGIRAPVWSFRVIGVSYDIRSRTGLEIFDLVGGIHSFIALDVAAGPEEPVLREYGGILDFGIISRSAETRFFVDTRLGGQKLCFLFQCHRHASSLNQLSPSASGGESLAQPSLS